MAATTRHQTTTAVAGMVVAAILGGCAAGEPESAAPAPSASTVSSATGSAAAGTSTTAPAIDFDAASHPNQYVYFSGADNPDGTATIGVAGPGGGEGVKPVTIPATNYFKVVKTAAGFAAAGADGVYLFDGNLAQTQKIDVPANTMIGATTSDNGDSTAIVLNTGDGEHPDGTTIVSVGAARSPFLQVMDTSPVALTQCDDGAIAWLEPDGDATADSAGNLPWIVTTHTGDTATVLGTTPAIPEPVFGRIDCATGAVAVMSLSSDGGAVAVTTTGTGEKATAATSPIPPYTVNDPAQGGRGIGSGMVDRGQLHVLHGDGQLETWSFTGGSVTHTATPTGLTVNPLESSVTYTGRTAVVAHPGPDGTIELTAIDTRSGACPSGADTVTVDGALAPVTSAVPRGGVSTECSL
ncbi:hypothetical protein ACFSSC_06745 [Corynebacterium mendelii]|uniref:Uncharacterized protein n=2 Tax=Corynebacterium mendelii TaxID=2765362 RepID=A0A939E3F1_9CORY|nr:hypothetical protein [Corynebacterium mendelii]MBN9644971.1 hypothetical protein [Corynebacterium mendelii]